MDTSTKHLSLENSLLNSTVEVLKEATPTSINNGDSKDISQSLNEALHNLFPEQAYEEKVIKTAKDILGTLADEFNPDELKCVIAETQFLAESWLDEFEREIFSGQTLREFLHEKGGI